MVIADNPVVFIYVTSGLAITVAPLVLISRLFGILIFLVGRIVSILSFKSLANRNSNGLGTYLVKGSSW